MTVRQTLVDQILAGREPFSTDAPALPTDLQGWQSQHKYLARAIETVRPSVVVEIGVWKGGSTATMAQTLQQLGVDGAVVSVDTWLGSSEHYLNPAYAKDLNFEAGYPRIYRQFAANMMNEGLADFVVPLPLDSINAHQVLAGLNIRPGVVHIDAGHDFASVTADLTAWWDLLLPGGVLIGDDYHKKWALKDGGKWPEVREAFDTFFKAHRHDAFESGEGKCWVRKPA